MTFEEFKAEYLRAFNKMMSYAPDEIGSGVYAEKLGELFDQHPGRAQQIEETA